MISKLSVKKPMTIFVTVILVLVLGVVSFMKMTPDLLPNLDLPYVVIITPYVGQTPETVETKITRPLEASLSTVDGVKKITSNSADSYSMVLIEFQDGADMDTATVDLRSGLDTLADGWDDAVGAPYLLKVNPNILPVSMAAVDSKGMGRAELSDFVSETLKNRLEAIDGVASVSDMGILTRQQSVVISEKKLNSLNTKLEAALESKFRDAEDKIEEAKQQLKDNIEQAQNGSAAIGTSIDEINKQQEALAAQLADARNQAKNGGDTVISAKMQLLDQKASLVQTKTLLETAYNTLLELKTKYAELLAERDRLTERIQTLSRFRDEINSIREALSDVGLTEEQKAQLNARLDEIKQELRKIDAKFDRLSEEIEAASKSLEEIKAAVAQAEERLTELGSGADLIDQTLSQLSEKISEINKGVEQLDAAISGLDDNTVTVNQALSAIEQQQSSADFKMSGAVAAMTSKQSELNSALAQLNAAQAELEKNAQTVSEQKQSAKEQADPHKMVTVENITGILAAQNFSMPAGYVKNDDNQKFLVRVGDEIKDKNELTSLPLFDSKIDGIGVIRLSDVADVLMTDNADEIYAKIDNKDGVVLSFTKQSDVATSTVCDNINNAFSELEKEFDGLRFTKLYSQGDYIGIIVSGVLQNLLSGAILAIIILFIFLRDIKPTIIVAVSIPVSVIFAVVLMYFSGITLNIISLSGLAIGVGMLVDNSVVVIENIYRLRAKGYSAIQASLNGARQVAGAITASTLTTICVFAPIVFVEGLTRQIFTDMTLTIAYSLLASLMIALTLVPAMGQGMLRKIREPKKSGEGAILRFYDKSIRLVLRHKITAVILAAALLLGSGALAFMRGFSFMPEMSSTQVEVDLTLDANATFEETVTEAEKINAVLNKYDEFETVGVITGSGMSLVGMTGMGGAGNAGSVSAYGVLKSDEVKNGSKLAEKIKKDLENVRGELSVSSSGMSSMSTILGENAVQISLFGDDLDKLRTTALDIAQKLEKLSGIEKADSGVGATSPEIRISVDKKKAAEKSLTVAQVFQQVASAVSEYKTATSLKAADGSSLDIVVEKDEEQKVSSDRIGSLDITYTDSEGKQKTVSLSSIADISQSETMNVIPRSDRKRMLSITGTVKKGFTLTDVTNEAKKLMQDYKLPPGFKAEFGGADKSTMEAISQMLQMMLLGVILIYLIMVAQFQSLKSPFIIMFTIPLAFTGGFIGLLITGFDVSVISMLGFVMLCGIIVNNGIVLVDYINTLRIEGAQRHEAIIEAGKTRMRPIFITALTTVFGLSVMALGIGTGAEMMQPLAIVCIGGLLYATIMTLYIVPAIYDLMNKKELRKVEEDDLIKIEE